MKKLLLILCLSLTFLSTATSAHWFNDGYGYVSNICRSGPYHS